MLVVGGFEIFVADDWKEKRKLLVDFAFFFFHYLFIEQIRMQYFIGTFLCVCVFEFVNFLCVFSFIR